MAAIDDAGGTWHDIWNNRNAIAGSLSRPNRCEYPLVQHWFRLIPSARPVTERSSLIELLRAAERTVFYSFPVENGCLWFRAMPEIITGQRVFTLRPNEFTAVLDEVVSNLRWLSRIFSI